MKENYTHIAALIDRSGSMGKLTTETILGFNKFLTDQKAVPGTATFSLATFASDYTLIHDFKSLNDIVELTTKTYTTGGYTSLYDSLAKLINSVGMKLAALNEDERPSKVILIIITDGAENASTEFTKEKVAEIISHQTEKYSWNFCYLGTDLSQMKEAASINIPVGNSFQYSADSAGVSSSYATLNSSLRKARLSSDVKTTSFFDQDTSVKKS